MRKTYSILFLIKVLLLVIFIGTSNLLFGQYGFVDSTSLANPCGTYQGNARHVRPFIDNLFCWAKYEIETDSIEKIELFNKLADPEKLGSYVYYDDYEEYYDSSSIIKVSPSNTHVIDYNKDGRPDFISTVWVPWEKTLYTEFWVNNGDNWEFDMKIEGQIVEFGYEETSSTPWFKTYHALCCGDYIHWLNTFKIIDQKWSLTDRLAFIGKLPPKSDPIVFRNQETIILNEGDTLLAFRDHNGVKLKPKELRDFKAIAIVKKQTKATFLYATDGPLNKRLSFVLLAPEAEFEKSFFRNDHRIRGINKEVKGDMKTYYGGWMLDVKRKK